MVAKSLRRAVPLVRHKISKRNLPGLPKVGAGSNGCQIVLPDEWLVSNLVWTLDRVI